MARTDGEDWPERRSVRLLKWWVWAFEGEEEEEKGWWGRRLGCCATGVHDYLKMRQTKHSLCLPKAYLMILVCERFSLEYGKLIISAPQEGSRELVLGTYLCWPSPIVLWRGNFMRTHFFLLSAHIFFY